jgi:hypothetical protein
MCIFVACSIIMELLSFVLWDWPPCAVNSMLAQTRLHPDVRKPVCSLDVLRGRRRARADVKLAYIWAHRASSRRLPLGRYLVTRLEPPGAAGQNMAKEVPAMRQRLSNRSSEQPVKAIALSDPVVPHTSNIAMHLRPYAIQRAPAHVNLHRKQRCTIGPGHPF